MIRVIGFAVLSCFLTVSNGEEKPSSLVFRLVDQQIANVGFWEIQGDLYAKYRRDWFKQAEKPERVFWRDQGVWFCEIRSDRIREFKDGQLSSWQRPPKGGYWVVAVLRVSSGVAGSTVAFENAGMFDGSRRTDAIEVRALNR